jgi:hypothetical protein
MTSRPWFSPICDLHHTSMRRVMVEEDSEETRSYHACERRNCTRIFRESTGYSDIIEGEFDQSRAAVRSCPACGASLYLSEVDHSRKIESWDCPGESCEFYGEFPSPSGQ